MLVAAPFIPALLRLKTGQTGRPQDNPARQKINRAVPADFRLLRARFAAIVIPLLNHRTRSRECGGPMV
jgi:hypothetical protein